jgi:drug/metabolite transporter (DMT)-like permease
LPRRDLLPLLALGGLGFGIYQILWATALQEIAAGDSALIIGATPVLVALFAVVAGSDTLTPLKLAGALISFVGVGLVIAGGTGLTLGATLVGDLLTLLAAICWAGYTAFAAPFLHRVSPLRTTAWAMVGGTLVLLPVGLLQLGAADLGAVEAGSWLGLAYSALLPAGIANVIVFQAVRLVGPTRITAFQFLVPAFAVVIAATFLAEPIHAGQVVGGAVIVAGVWLTRRRHIGVGGLRLRPRSA